MFNNREGFSYTLIVGLYSIKRSRGYSRSSLNAYFLRPFSAMRAIKPTKINRAIVGIGSSDTFNLDRVKSNNWGRLRTEPPPAIPITSANCGVSCPSCVRPTASRGRPSRPRFWMARRSGRRTRTTPRTSGSTSARRSLGLRLHDQVGDVGHTFPRGTRGGPKGRRG